MIQFIQITVSKTIRDCKYWVKNYLLNVDAISSIVKIDENDIEVYRINGDDLIDGASTIIRLYNGGYLIVKESIEQLVNLIKKSEK